VLTNWRRCRGTPALVTTTLMIFYFICYILFDSPGDSTGYRGDSTGNLQAYLPVLIPSQSLVLSSNKTLASFIGTRLFLSPRTLLKVGKNIDFFGRLFSTKHYGECIFDIFIFSFIFISS
jgi:hypothetical protein